MAPDDLLDGGPMEGPRYYERGAVRRFLELADAARERLEHQLQVALERERAALEALDELAADDAPAELVRTAGAVGRSVSEDRELAWDAVASVLAGAEAEAAALRHAAEERAAELLTAATGRGEPGLAPSHPPVPVAAHRWGRSGRPAAEPRNGLRLLAG